MHYTKIGWVLALLSGAAIAGSTPACAGSYKVLYSFGEGLHGSGSYPVAGLIKVGGTLYGSASESGGTIFSFNRRDRAEKVLYRFDGGEPQDTMIDLDGTLYGITAAGGANQWGAVYGVQPGTGKERTVYSFQGGADGYFPEAGLLNVRGMLFGTTVGGGESQQGMVFAVDPGTGTKQVVYSFAGGNGDGSDPQSDLINVNGTLYGTTRAGGPGAGGTVYAVNPKNGKEKVVHFFAGGSDGIEPYAGLINVAGTLYGATLREGGGSCFGGCGTLFSIDLSTGTETVLYIFQGGADGANPTSALLNVGGILYGTTGGGGAGCSAITGCGTVFSIDPETGKEKVLHVFRDGSDGSRPSAPLIDVGGTLYGTTYAGGGATFPAPCFQTGCGTIFSYRP